MAKKKKKPVNKKNSVSRVKRDVESTKTKVNKTNTSSAKTSAKSSNTKTTKKTTATNTTKKSSTSPAKKKSLTTTNKKTQTKKTTISNSAKKSSSNKKQTVKTKTPEKVEIKKEETIYNIEILDLKQEKKDDKECKPQTNSSKILKKNEKQKYNVVEEKKKTPKKKKLSRKEKKQYRKEQLLNDELVLLKYKDYKGFSKIGVFFKNRIKVIKYDMKRFGKRLRYGTIGDKLLILLMLFMIVGFCCVIVFCTYVVMSAPEISEKRLYKNNSTVMYDKDGIEFARLGTENREKVNYDQLPQVLIDAIVATEDSRFFQHNGIDIARFTMAAIGQVMGRSDAGGGSTLTMQVSKNAATSVVASGIEGIVRKFTDIYLSVFVFEQRYTKEQIIEFYVNIPYLGGSSYGVEQASQTYFGKSVSELTLTEAALIAGLFQAPDAYDPFNYPELAQDRRDTVLGLMYRHGYITKKQRDIAQSIPVESLLIEKNTKFNEFQGFIDTVVQEVIQRTTTDLNPTGDNPYNVAMKIYTTLDREKQLKVNKINDGDAHKFKNDVAQTGIAVVDKNGAIPVIFAGRNKTTQRSLNYATSVRNHPGSTAKPIVDYGPAFEYLDWSTGQTILDEKMTYTGGASIRNFDGKFKGVMTVKEALAQSRNIPALFTFQQTTHEQKLEFSSNLGWEVLTDGNGHILETCSIGGFDGTTALEVAAAYAAFARGGTYIEPYSFTKLEYTESGDVFEVEPKKVQVMSEETAYMINMILKYAVTSGRIGTGSVSGTDIAAKTGTSTIGEKAIKDLGIKASDVIGDSWTAVYSPDYTVAIWYGYPERTKEYYLTDREARPARTNLTKYMVKTMFKKNSRFKKPSGVTTAEIEIGTDPIELASEFTPKSLRSKEYFKKGTVPTTTSTRFSQLENPTNLSYSATNSSVTLSWSPIATPSAIDTQYLTDYFSKSNAYKKWVEKALETRLSYNSKNIGDIGYQIYMKNASGTQNLGFTTSTTFTALVAFDEQTEFIVKSSYSIFKDNQSSGVSVSVKPNSSTPIPEEPITKPSTSKTTTTTEKVTYSIQYKGSSACTTLEEYNALGASAADKFIIKSNGVDVTKDATITLNGCYDKDVKLNSCSEMVKGKEYEILYSILYKGVRRSKTINIKTNC